MDTIDRLPKTGDRGIYLKQQLKDKLIEHKQYIDKNGEDLPEIRNWQWGCARCRQIGVNPRFPRGAPDRSICSVDWLHSATYRGTALESGKRFQ